MVQETKSAGRLKPSEAATLLRVSPSTLAKWRMRGEGPAFIRCGRRLIFYDVAAIEAWLESQRSDRK
jgi:hypothetical protein